MKAVTVLSSQTNNIFGFYWRFIFFDRCNYWVVIAVWLNSLRWCEVKKIQTYWVEWWNEKKTTARRVLMYGNKFNMNFIGIHVGWSIRWNQAFYLSKLVNTPSESSSSILVIFQTVLVWQRHHFQLFLLSNHCMCSQVIFFELSWEQSNDSNLNVMHKSSWLT